jgi:hypothetical protein
MKSGFADRRVSVTLTGKQWFALIAKLADKPLSREGMETLREAASKLAEQVK